MRAVIGIICRCAIWWHEIEIEKGLAALAQAPIPIDHGEGSEAECTDTYLTGEVYIWPRSIRV